MQDEATVREIMRLSARIKELEAAVANLDAQVREHVLYKEQLRRQLRALAGEGDGDADA